MFIDDAPDFRNVCVICHYNHICAMHVLRYAREMHLCIVHDIIYDSAYTFGQHPAVLTVVALLH